MPSEEVTALLGEWKGYRVGFVQRHEPDVGEGGNHGAGDIRLTAFCRLFEETENLPALGGFLQGRFPTGDGSSGVDGTLSAMLTKTIWDRIRFHIQGFLQTANGGVGDEDDDRRPFQWGIGPGLDFELGDETMLTLNYLHRVNSEEGEPSQNILELGLAHEIGDWGKTEHGIKLAVDFGVDGLDSTPDFGAKVLWDMTWNER